MKEEKKHNPWVRLQQWNARQADKEDHLIEDKAEEKVEVKSAYKEPEVVSESIVPAPLEKPHLNLYEKDTLHWTIHKEVYNAWLDALSHDKRQHILSHPDSPEANRFNDSVSHEVSQKVQYSINILGKK
jgi:hypothetical protein